MAAVSLHPPVAFATPDTPIASRTGLAHRLGWIHPGQAVALSGQASTGRVFARWPFAWLMAVTLVLSVAPAVAQVVDPTLWVTNGSVQAVARKGNTVYIGGRFSRVGPATGQGVPLSAVDGGPVHPFPKVLGPVLAIVPDASGGWYIGGSFSAVGGLPRSNLAHILADGRVDAWSPNTNGLVRALGLSGGTLYVGGDFTSVGELTRNHIAALDAASITGSRKTPIHAMVSASRTMRAMEHELAS